MAAESLPDSPLYPAKMMMEDARISLASDEVELAETHLDIAGERLQEMERLMVDGKMPEDALLARAENHVEAAFGLAADMPSQNMAGVLAQAQEMVQTRTRAFADIEAQIPTEVEPAYKQVQQMLQNAGEVAAAGLQNPQLLRNRHTLNRPEDAPEQPEMMPPAVISPTEMITTPVRIGPAGPCAANEDCEPQGDGPYGPNPNGPQPEEPGEGAGPGEPNGNQIGPPEDHGSDTEHGNPDSGCTDCQNGNQHQYGPQPDDSGNGDGMPGGSESGIPIGGQNQNGTQYHAPGSDEDSAPPADSSPSDSGHSGSGSSGKNK
jgi:hypothetical protein